jgi:hypothetical protein
MSVHHDDNQKLVQPFDEVDNHGDLQPQVIVYVELVHLHQLQHVLGFKTNHQISPLLEFLIFY